MNDRVETVFMTFLACPGLDDLLAFSVGRTAATVCEEIAEHLKACPSCVQVLQFCRDEADPLMRDLRQRFPALPITEESCRRILDRVAAITVHTSFQDTASRDTAATEA